MGFFTSLDAARRQKAAISADQASTNSPTPLEDQLPWHVRDHQLETHFPDNSGLIVIHEFDEPDAPPSSPPRLERWASDRQPVGSGGQGKVYIQRRDTGSGSYALRAVKAIPLGDGAGSKTRRYRRELETNFRFSHPKYSKYFVRSLGWYLSRHSSSLCIAMEYLSQGDLQTYLTNNPPLNEDECREIVSQVFKGLQTMHKEGFAHRDVKPANVLIQQCPKNDASDCWWVKLTDFGISKPLEVSAAGNTTLYGTPGYMPPEILRQLLGLDLQGESIVVDYPAADMWSLGIIMFRILTGTDPFPSLPDVLKYCNYARLFPISPRVTRQISPEGVAFTCALLQPFPIERQTAVGHVWIQRQAASRPSNPPAHPGFNPQTSVEAPRPKTVDDERGLTTQLSNITAIQSRLSLDDRPQAPVLAPLTQEPESSSAYKEDDNGSTVLLDGLRPWPVPPHLYRCPLKECAKGLPEGEYRRVWNYESFIRHLLEGHVYGDKHDVYSTRVSGPEQILLWASRRGHDAIIKTLLDNGTNVETRDRRGYTPLAAAAYEGYDNVVGLLLDKGADREARNKNARTPLALATRKGDVDSLKLLIQRGADIDSRDSFGDTPLTVAATYSHEEVVEQLVQGGANLESRNDGDNTPLLLATGARRRAIVRLLLKYGANPESKNKAGYSPLSIAETRTDDGILRLLQDAVEGRRPTEP